MDWFRSALIEAHKRQRDHLKWVINGLDESHMIKELTSDENISSILKTLLHIGNAETYWFHKNGHGIGPPIGDSEVEAVLKRLEENTEKIAEIVRTCDDDHLQIRTGHNKQTPSVAWSVLRTYQHGIYHSGQIAKMRRIVGAPDLPSHKDDVWSSAVDAIIEIVDRLHHG
ncbi:MAG: DinB family protein [Candidatus Thorarchaeota archaeon]